MNSTDFDRDIEETLGKQFAELYERTPEAQRPLLADDLWLVLEGGYGDQVYLTVPFRCLRDRAQTGIGLLLRELDLAESGGNEAALDHANVRLVRPRTEEELEAIGRESGATRDELAAAYGMSWETFAATNRMYVPGGSGGGGQLEDDRVWLHHDFCTPDDIDWHARAAELLHLEIA